MSVARVLSCLRTDMRLQWRHGLWLACIFVALFYVVLLRSLPPGTHAALVPPLLLSEVSVIGFFFAGTLIHFERTDGTLLAIALTPLSTAEYLCARTISLTLLAAAAAFLITLGGTPHLPRLLLLGTAAAGTAALFALLGIAVASRFAALEQFAVWGGLGTAILGLPVLPWFGLAESRAWFALPTWPVLALFGQALHRDVAAHILPPALALGLLGLWLIPAFVLAHAWIGRYAHGRTRAPR